MELEITYILLLPTSDFSLQGDTSPPSFPGSSSVSTQTRRVLRQLCRQRGVIQSVENEGGDFKSNFL